MPSKLERELATCRREVGDKGIAQAIEGDKTTVSRVFSDQMGIKLSRLEAFLAVMGYRAIPINQNIVEVPAEHYESMVQMCNIGAQSLSLTDFHPRYSRGLDLRQPLVLVGAGQCSRGE